MYPVPAVHRRVVYALLLTFLLSLGLSTASASAPPLTDSKSIRSVIIGKAELPRGPFLPVFQFLTPQISTTNTTNLAVRFESIYMEQEVYRDEYLGNTRFTVPNTDTNSILEQYGATGGFYAYNVVNAFGTTAQGSIVENDAEYLACQLLLQNELFPPNVTLPDHQNCDFDPETFEFADVSLVHASDDTSDTVVAASVRVPMYIDLAQLNLQGSPIPLGGPGGHISLIFRTTNPDAGAPSLDQSVPGLAAVAMPFYGREFEFFGNYPAVDPAGASATLLSQLQSTYPNATEIIMPVPRLMFTVHDAAVPQRAFEPELVFQGIQVTDNGNTFFIKDVSVPATTGFGPTVSITAPANGTTFTAGQDVTFIGDITQPDFPALPYTYSWTLDDGTVLMSGTATTTGTISFTTNALPVVAHDTTLAPVVVYLSVEDANGARRQASIVLQPTAPTFSNALYLPLVMVNTTGGTRAITTPMANYSFGLEQASDYPPYGAGGADLGGVPGDISGFRSGLSGIGWDQRFFWSNASAWEKDWRDCSLGGGDCSYGVDRTDFVYFSGHGGGGGISMPSNVDSGWFAGTNARYQNARWIAFSSCQTLRAQFTPASSAPIRDWFNAFQGAHMLLGFNSNMADIHFGGRLVDNMRIPTFLGIFEMPWAQRTIADAWVQTAFEMNAGKPAYLFAIGTNGVNPSLEKLPRANDPLRARPFPVATYNWVWWDE